jgi:GNAT superfamily N-acetyltransferase
LTGTVAVRPVRAAADLKKFIAFPYRLHRGDPQWVPPLRMDMRKLLSRRKNPFFQHAEAEYFLAERRGGGSAEVVGRIAAIHNRGHNEFHEDTVGFYGFFESINDQSVADSLFHAAASWLKQRGLTVMRGPVSFSTNDECGLLIDGFDLPPAVLTPYTPAHYVDLTERAGFTKARDLFLYQSVNDQLPERLIRGAQLIAKRKKITLRSIDMKRFSEEVELIKKVYNSAWERNWGFIPMTEAEIDHLAKDLKPVIVPELVVFAEREGELIGFAVALPDLNVALKTNPSGRLFPGILKILWKARKITRLRIMLLGVVPEYRRYGADALMYHWIWDKGYALGYRWGEAGWILEDNAAMNNGLLRMGFERYKTLRLFDRPL